MKNTKVGNPKGPNLKQGKVLYKIIMHFTLFKILIQSCHSSETKKFPHSILTFHWLLGQFLTIIKQKPKQNKNKYLQLFIDAYSILIICQMGHSQNLPLLSTGKYHMLWEGKKLARPSLFWGGNYALTRDWSGVFKHTIIIFFHSL